MLLDVDALAKAEGENWVWRGCVSLPPEHRRGLVQLSRGGADAMVIREFDLDGQALCRRRLRHPRNQVGRDLVRRGHAAGGGHARRRATIATTSGYPRTVRRWRRGTPFESAPVVFEGERTDMLVWGWREHSPRKPRTFFIKRTDFENSVLYVEDDDGSLRPFDIPRDADVYIEGNWLILNLRSDWPLGGRQLSGRRAAGDRHRRVPGRQPRLRRAVRADADLFPAGLPGRGQRRRASRCSTMCARAFCSRACSDGAWRTEPVSRLSRAGDGRLLSPVARMTSIGPSEEAREDLRHLVRRAASLPPSLSLARAGQATRIAQDRAGAVRRRRARRSRSTTRCRSTARAFPISRSPAPICRSTARTPACSAAMADSRSRACRIIRCERRQAVAGARRRLRDRQYPRRRRVRAGLAQGRHARRQEARA